MKALVLKIKPTRLEADCPIVSDALSFPRGRLSLRAEEGNTPLIPPCCCHINVQQAQLVVQILLFVLTLSPNTKMPLVTFLPLQSTFYSPEYDRNNNNVFHKKNGKCAALVSPNHSQVVSKQFVLWFLSV